MIRVNEKVVEINHFPDGTLRLNILPSNTSVIKWVYEKEEELSALIYITKHIKNCYPFGKIVLEMNYVPNARMDRTENNEEVFTLKYFADVINWLGFSRVYIMDAHSNVSKALLNNCVECKVINRMSIYNTIEKIESLEELKGVVFYFPDKGSVERYSKLLNIKNYCYGEKKRDWNTGKILGLKIQDNGIDLKDKTILMIDDIISYGGSLYYSAKALKEIGVGKVYAYATHTENSILDKEKGTLIKALENNTVEKLFTTNSLFTGKHEKIEVMEV